MNKLSIILCLLTLNSTAQEHEGEIEQPKYAPDNWEFVDDKIKYFTIAGNSDVLNSLNGITISNGIDEKPLLHFEDLNNNCLYKVCAQSDFMENYSIDLRLGWNLPSRRLHFITINLLSIDYIQKKIDDGLLYHRNLNLTTEILVKPLPFIIITKGGVNEINTKNYYGGEIGIRKSWREIYLQTTFGFYSKFKTLSAVTECNIYKNSLFLRNGILSDSRA
jgi:hypothetical protein